MMSYRDTSLATPQGLRSGSWKLVTAAFVCVGVALACADGFALRETHAAQVEADSAMRNEIGKLTLVQRMSDDTYRGRLLIDAHVFEKHVLAMNEIEEKLAAVRADYESAAQSYPLRSADPEETRVWKSLEDHAHAIQTPLAGALELSRENDDVQARAAVSALEPRFSDVESDIRKLVSSHRDRTRRAQQRVNQLQGRATRLSIALAAFSGALPVAVAFWIARVVRRRDLVVQHYSTVLEAHIRDLDAFAGRVAHDLRGRLTTISMAVTALVASRPEESAAAERLQRAITNMSSLIEDLLAFSRLSRQDRDARGDPACAARQVCEDLSARLEMEGAALHSVVEPASVPCDEGLLRQVLWNLVENAIKYRRPGTKAEISLIGQTVDDGYEIRVSDNGLGMSPDDARQVFDSFYRAPRTSERQGLGLGLSIVKRVIEASGGTVSVESQLDRGSTFTIRLPLVGNSALSPGT